MAKVHVFNAGPCLLPQPVIDELERAQLTQNRIYRLEGGLPVEEVRP